MTYTAEQLAEASRLGAATLHKAASRIGALPPSLDGALILPSARVIDRAQLFGVVAEECLGGACAVG